MNKGCIKSSSSIVGFSDKEDFIRFSKNKIAEMIDCNGEEMPKEINIKSLESGNYMFEIKF